MKKIIEEINHIVRNELWFEFEIIKCSSESLTIRGGLDIFDIGSPYEFIITFSDIFMISSLVSWKIDTSKNFLYLVQGEEAKEINIKFQVTQGYSIFKFLVEDYEENNEFIIIAESINYQIPLETDSIEFSLKDNT